MEGLKPEEEEFKGRILTLRERILILGGRVLILGVRIQTVGGRVKTLGGKVLIHFHAVDQLAWGSMKNGAKSVT